MISLFTSIKNMTLWRTRVLKSFDGEGGDPVYYRDEKVAE